MVCSPWLHWPSWPDADWLVMLRLRTEDSNGNRSQGILVPASEVPAEVTNVVATGVDGGLEFSWERAEDPAGGFRITSPMHGFEAVDLPPGDRAARLDGLENARLYQFQLEVVDRDGQAWPGPEIRAMAGEGVAIPSDASAWWTFDESAIRSGYSIGDESGNGNTLFVGNDKVSLVDGVLGKALQFDGETAYAKVLSPTPLAIGTGGFAVSFWIRQVATPNMTQRVFEFGGTGEPGLSIMANDTDVRVLFTAGETRYAPFYRGLEMTNKWMHVVVNVDRAGDLSIWVNGERLVAEDISVEADVEIAAAPYLHLGRFKNATNPKHNWPGDLDQVRIFQRALTPAEIDALAAEGNSGS
ncbi:MAG: LamG domain-containing protein [Terrimicrobiaceae bacterium]